MRRKKRHKMIKKTNIGLVEYCYEQLGLPYWWGTFGQVASKSLYEQKKKQYPNQYTASDFSSQYGKRVHDCVGLIKGYLWTNAGKIIYDASQDKDVSGMLQNCNEIGDISKIPEVRGLLVFMKGHVGIYVGDGEVIEAKGHKFGVVKTKLSDRPWTTYGKLKWIDYQENEMEEPTMEEKQDRIKSYYGFDDNTIKYFTFYKYGTDLIEKLYKKA